MLFDVIVIGAGPSGAVASALLSKKGHRVLVLEREKFPRFSIGESLLPHCMEFIDEAEMTQAVNAANFQRKNGAVFQHKGRYCSFDFREKFSEGPGETFQVKRADFDKILADAAAGMGINILYDHRVSQVEIDRKFPRVTCNNPDHTNIRFESKYILDASGFGRTLPKLLGLEKPSDFPEMSSLFCHMMNIKASDHFDREKILISVHPDQKDVWFWLIPFSDGTYSVGAVAPPSFFDNRPKNLDKCMWEVVREEPELRKMLSNAKFCTSARKVAGYAASASHLATEKYALLGNAGEFLDPIFSSGVTIALHSASLAARVLDRQLKGETVDWSKDYSEPLKTGIDTFREFVSAWYDGRLQKIIFHKNKSGDVQKMISSVLAGYAWDESNPFVSESKKRLDLLWRYCLSQHNGES